MKKQYITYYYLFLISIGISCMYITFSFRMAEMYLVALVCFVSSPLSSWMLMNLVEDKKKKRGINMKKSGLLYFLFIGLLLAILYCGLFLTISSGGALIIMSLSLFLIHPFIIMIYKEFVKK